MPYLVRPSFLLRRPPGPRFNIKMTSYQYRKSHYWDKTILRPSYLHNGISYTGKMTSLYWIRAQVSNNARASAGAELTINLVQFSSECIWQSLSACRWLCAAFYGTGPCFTTATWRCRKNFSQWERSFRWKLRCHWLKGLRQRQIAVVRQDPDNVIRNGRRDFVLLQVQRYIKYKGGRWFNILHLLTKHGPTHATSGLRNVRQLEETQRDKCERFND